MTSVIGGNLSQTLFNQNMKTLKLEPEASSTAMKFANMKSIAGLNAIESQDEELRTLTPAFIEQANLSTWYQSNPWGILTASSKYGVTPLGGPVNLEQPPGYRPGNVLMTQKPKQSVMSKLNIRENFGSGSSSEEPSSSYEPSSIETSTGSTGSGFFQSAQGKFWIAAIVFLVLLFAWAVYTTYNS